MMINSGARGPRLKLFEKLYQPGDGFIENSTAFFSGGQGRLTKRSIR